MATAFEAQSQPVAVWKFSDLSTAMDTATGPTIFNFWATFCAPCVAELPAFQKAADQYRHQGVKLILVSLDLKEAYPKTIRRFIKKREVTSPVVFLDESNTELFVPAVDAAWSGAIPASLFINPRRGYRHFVEEELNAKKLDAEIRKMLE